jgi:hypothetical protein
MFLVLSIDAIRPYIEEHYFSIPHFETHGATFSGFRIFPFSLGGPSVGLPNFTFLPDLEMG